MSLGDEHTYEGSLVDNYEHSGYPQPGNNYNIAKSLPLIKSQNANISLT